MKKVKVNFLFLALIAGAVSAFAFNTPEKHVQLFGRVTDSNGNFIRWEAAASGYSCDEASGICTAQLVNDDPALGQPIPETETSGKYVP